MNKVYKLKFVKATQSLQAVSELATNAVAEQSSSNRPEDDSSSSGLGWSEPSSELESLDMLSVNLQVDDHRVKTTSGLVNTSATTNLGIASTSLSLSSATKTKISTTLASIGAISALGFAGQAMAAPSGAEVVSGHAQIVQDGLVTSIKNSPNAIINWQQFNIGTNEVVRFIQQNANSAVLNRVVGGNISKILGTLQSNGKVFLVNPNGIVFGKGATVDVQSMIASTLDISNENFKSGKYVFDQAKDSQIAKVINQGMIKVNPNGTLALIGGQVANQGILEARNGSVYLLAGNSIEFTDFNNPNISFKVKATNKAINLGMILGKNVTMLGSKVSHGKAEIESFADLVAANDDIVNQARVEASGEVLLYGGSESDVLQSTQQTNAQVSGKRNSLVEVNAVINTTSKEGKLAQVKVLADKIFLGNNSKIIAGGDQGGSVRIGGDAYGKGDYKLSQLTVAESGQLINVSGKQKSGNAVLWGDYAWVDGTFTADSTHGAGGLIETSGHKIDIQANIKVSTKGTELGSWLIDPNNIYIVASYPAGIQQNEKLEGQGSFSADDTGTGVSGLQKYQVEASPDHDTYILNSTLNSWLDGQTDAHIILKATGNISVANVTIQKTNPATGTGILTLDTVNATLPNTGHVDIYNSTIQLNQLNIQANNSVNITASNLSLKAKDDTLGEVNILSWKGGVKFEGSNLSAENRDTIFNATVGNIDIINSNFVKSASGSANLIANGAAVTINNSKLEGLTVNATLSTSVTSSLLNSTTVICTTGANTFDNVTINGTFNATS